MLITQALLAARGIITEQVIIRFRIDHDSQKGDDCTKAQAIYTKQKKICQINNLSIFGMGARDLIRNSFVYANQLYLSYFNKTLGKTIVHVETPHIFGDELIAYARNEKRIITCYCITPENFEFVRTEFGINIDKKEFARFLTDYYSQLQNAGANIQLHVHLTQFPDLLSNEEKQDRIHNAYYFLKDVNASINEITFGWFKWDGFSEECCKALGLKVMPHHFHIYDRWITGGHL